LNKLLKKSLIKNLEITCSARKSRFKSLLH